MAKKKESNGGLVAMGIALLLLLSKPKSGSAPGQPGSGSSGGSSATSGIVSKYYTMDDVRRSSKAKELGITEQFSAALTQTQLRDLNAFIKIVLDPLTTKLGSTLEISSWWRHPKLNDAVGGVDDSYHEKAVAIDFKNIKNGTLDNAAVIRALYQAQLPFTELIFYGSKTNPTSFHLAFDYLKPVEKEVLYKRPDGEYEEISNEFIYNQFLAA
jgi:hypothetical protein